MVVVVDGKRRLVLSMEAVEEASKLRSLSSTPPDIDFIVSSELSDLESPISDYLNYFSTPLVVLNITTISYSVLPHTNTHFGRSCALTFSKSKNVASGDLLWYHTRHQNPNGRTSVVLIIISNVVLDV